jgi:S1-C subfamily serine protease
MRPGQVVAVALIAAVLGGLVALGGGLALGLGGDDDGSGGGNTVVLTTETDGSSASAASAKPLLGNGFDPAEIYRRRSQGVVTIYSYFADQPTENPDHAAQGSGFVVSPQGHILTSAHVITTAGETGPTKPAEKVFVAFRDGDRVDATILGFDLNDDVGVLKVDPRDHKVEPVPLGDSAKVAVGEPVAAIGSPFGNVDSLAVGVVSSNSRSIPSLTSRYNVVDAIQTDAPITHGNSGGPLLDARGRVIGINAQIRSDTGDTQGVGFAIPINAARRSMKQLVEEGRVAYAYVGVTASTLTPTLAERFGYTVDRGAVVDQIAAGSPGLHAGLRCGRDEESFRGTTFKRGGDVIVAIDGRPVRSADDLVRIVSERLEPGQQSTFELVRGDKRQTVAVKLGKRPSGRAANACS